LLQALFSKPGLPPNFADYINIPDNTSKIIAMQQGRVVAAFMSPPTDQPLLKGGFKRLVYGGDEFKAVPFSAVLATAKTIKEEPDLTERMVSFKVSSGSVPVRGQHRHHHEARQAGSAGRLPLRYMTSCAMLLFRLWIEGDEAGEIEIVLLKGGPTLSPSNLSDDRFYKAALKRCK
jgi:hypothetical protein